MDTKYTKIREIRLNKGLTLNDVSKKSDNFISENLLSQYERDVKSLFNSKYIIVKKLAEIYDVVPEELFYEDELEQNLKAFKPVRKEKIPSKKILLYDYIDKYIKEFYRDTFLQFHIENDELKNLLNIDEFSKTYNTNGYIVYKIINPVVELFNKNNNLILTKSQLTENGIDFYVNGKEK